MHGQTFRYTLNFVEIFIIHTSPFFSEFYIIIKIFKFLLEYFLCVDIFVYAYFENTFGRIPEMFHKMFYRDTFIVHLLHHIFNITFEKNNASFFISESMFVRKCIFKCIFLILF